MFNVIKMNLNYFLINLASPLSFNPNNTLKGVFLFEVFSANPKFSYIL